jgi:hypothetical protein
MHPGDGTTLSIEPGSAISVIACFCLLKLKTEKATEKNHQQIFSLI